MEREVLSLSIRPCQQLQVEGLRTRPRVQFNYMMSGVVTVSQGEDGEP